MAKEHFFLDENRTHLKLLDEAARRASVSRGRAFDDFLHMAVTALSGGAMEQEYLGVVGKYSTGQPGKRGIDSLCELFAGIIAASETTRDDIRDVLGDLFEGGISYGEAGQYFTPMNICRLNARLILGEQESDDQQTFDEITTPESETADIPLVVPAPNERKSVYDPACGSGRMLLAVAEVHRGWTFVGRDVDLRCVRMTCLNMALRNLYGYVIHGNSLKDEVKLVYRTGLNARGGVIRYATSQELNQQFGVEHQPEVDSRPAATATVPLQANIQPVSPFAQPGKQLRLF